MFPTEVWKLINLHSKSWTFNFNLSYFDTPKVWKLINSEGFLNLCLQGKVVGGSKSEKIVNVYGIKLLRLDGEGVKNR